MVKKSPPPIFLVAGLALASLVVFIFFGTKEAQAGAADNLSGFAWSENIGWISFNCNNPELPLPRCANNYGVNVDPPTGVFSGYAWAENIGWITFNEVDLTGCPSGTCQAKLDFATRQISGWVKVLSNSSWIRLRGTAQDGNPYGVFWNNTTQELEGWAWSDTDVGWISFNRVNCDPDKDGFSNGIGACPPTGTPVANYKVIAQLDNTSPTVSVLGAPANWQNTDATASVSCSDGTGSGCDTGSYKLKTYTSSGTCSVTYSDYTLSSPQTISSHLWVCAAAKDLAGNEGFSPTRVEFKVDKQPPGSYIYLPTYAGLDPGSWQTTGSFTRPVLETEEGGSGLKNCTYQIWVKGVGFRPVTARACNTSIPDTDPITITVGPTATCSTEGENACILYVFSYDEAGNNNTQKEDYTGEGQGYTSYHIDWTAPSVGKPYVFIEGEDPIRVTEGQPIPFKSSVSDTGGIANCDLLIDGQSQYDAGLGYMNLSASPCTDCTASLTYPGFADLSTPHYAKVKCWDQYYTVTGDISHITVGPQATIVKNQLPEITAGPSYTTSPCPQPTTQPSCDVDFTATIKDDDNDDLTYTWDFGDGTTTAPATVSPPYPTDVAAIHHYDTAGTFTVTLTIDDGRGGIDNTPTVNVTVTDPTLLVDLTANPNSGVYPLNDVDLTATVSETMYGTINYKFDCQIENGDCTTGVVFGYTDIGGTTYPSYTFGRTIEDTGSLMSNYLDLSKFTLSKPGTAISMSSYGGVNGKAKVGIYNDSGGNPNNLLVGPVESTVTGGTWTTYNIPATFLPSGDYWIANNPNSAGAIRAIAGTGTLKYKALNYADLWPDPATGLSDYSETDDVYVTYIKIKGYIKATKAILSQGGSINRIKFYSHSDSGNARVAIYDDSGGAPNNLKVQSGSQPLISGWNNFDIPNTFLVAGTYWLTWQVDGAGSQPSYLTGSVGDGYYRAYSYGSFPSIFGSGTGSAEKYSIYATGACDYEAPDQTTESHTISDLCDYPIAGIYTAKTLVERGTGNATDTATITVSANQPPVAGICCQSCASPNCTTYTGDVFTLINNSTDPNGAGDINQSDWDILTWGLDPDLSCTPPTALCNFTVQTQIVGRGDYTAELFVRDLSGANDTASQAFTILQDALADFQCSLDDSTWKNCLTLRPAVDEIVYFLDQSTPSEGAAITNRSWSFQDGIPATGTGTNPSTQFQSGGPKQVNLTIIDSAGRTASQNYTLTIQLPLPEWQEIPPF